MKKTIVLGASPNPARYAYIAVMRLKAAGHEVIPIGIREGEIDGIPIVIGKPEIEDVHTITIYLNPQRLEEYYDWMLDVIKPKRLIFNPGAEEPHFMWRAKTEGFEVLEACTLVLLATGQY
jgi:hypothetical protein